MALVAMGMAVPAQAQPTQVRPSAARTTVDPPAHACPLIDQLCPGDDLDGDGISDVTVGQPTESVTGTVGSGTMDLHLTHVGDQRIDEQWVSPGFTATSSDRFGAASASDDVDVDGYGDLIVGAPGAGGTGDVFIAHGSSAGISHTGTQILHGLTAGEDFGATIALSGYNLWIGAPTRTVNGQAGAGAMDWYVEGTDNLFHLRMSITQDSFDVGGSAEAGDRFASALSASSYGVLVGVPGEDIGTIKDAGLITYFEIGSGPSTTYQSFSSYQGSGGVTGVPEAGDRFGASVALSPQYSGYALVGVPGEGIGTAAGTGLVQL